MWRFLFCFPYTVADILSREELDDACLRDSISIASTDSFVSAAEVTEAPNPPINTSGVLLQCFFCQLFSVKGKKINQSWYFAFGCKEKYQKNLKIQHLKKINFGSVKNKSHLDFFQIYISFILKNKKAGRSDSNIRFCLYKFWIGFFLFRSFSPPL